jgi:hypothetical protein
MKAGWICVTLGFLTFWIFGFGFLFFSVATVCAIVAMCTNEVQRGLVLLVSSVVSSVICGVLFFVLALGTVFGTVGVVGAAAEKAAKERQAQTAAQQRVVKQSIDFNAKTSPVQGPARLYPTVQTRSKVIDGELRAWQVTGRPDDVDRRRELLAEWKRLTGQDWVR